MSCTQSASADRVMGTRPRLRVLILAGNRDFSRERCHDATTRPRLVSLAAACSGAGGPTAPTASTNVTEATGAQVQATNGGPVEVSFVKWLHPTLGFPSFVGEAGGDGPGSFAATVLERTPFENGDIVDLRARYEYLADDGQRSFVAVIEGNRTLRPKVPC